MAIIKLIEKKGKDKMYIKNWRPISLLNVEVKIASKENKLSGLLLAIDFEKAFDSLDWTFLNKALSAFNFSQSFIKWVNTFYSNIQSCVMNNGFSSVHFDVMRGVR